MAPKPMITPPVQPSQPIVQKQKQQKPVQPLTKKKLLDDKKRVNVPKKSIQENNVTHVAQKPVVKKIIKKIVKQPIQKPASQRIAKTVPPKKVPARKTQQKASKDPLANALMGSGTSMFRPKASNASGYGDRMIKELYGKEFDGFSDTQKQFIRANLGAIHRITQMTLTYHGYPEVAVRTGQQGTNVVSFDLHPNGEITNLRLRRPIGYAALDDNTLEVIRIAYKDYPRPSKTTKIVFYVQYRLY